MINNDDLEKLFQIYDGNKIRVIGYSRVPMLELSIKKEDDKYHFYEDPNIGNEDSCQVFPKLVRKIQQFYSICNVFNYLDPVILYNTLFSIELSQIQNKLYIDQSFTYFHWKVAEALQNPNDPYEIKNMSADEIKMMALNIFP